MYANLEFMGQNSPAVLPSDASEERRRIHALEVGVGRLWEYVGDLKLTIADIAARVPPPPRRPCSRYLRYAVFAALLIALVAWVIYLSGHYDMTTGLFL